ncbi:MAG TPA: flagellar protein FlgN [Burkholderiales bacterium]|nr:flagellar protein FlgN [Burkholderiales bacterium]
MAVESTVNPPVAGAAAALSAEALDDEAAVWRDLISLLQQEQAALRAADAMKLPSLAAAKQQRIALLQQFEQQREVSLRAAGYGTGPAAMSGWLAAHESSAAQSWAKLRRLASDARQINRLNGRLITQQRRHFEQALHALAGAAGAAALYGADGLPQQLALQHRGATAG